MVVAVNVTVYGYIQPYKSLLANLLEIAVNINFLFLLLINSTSFFHEDMFTFSDISSNSTSSDCGSSIAGIAHVSWLLMPVYYLPILGLSITAAMFAIHFIRYIIMCVISKVISHLLCLVLSCTLLLYPFIICHVTHSSSTPLFTGILSLC